MSTAYGTPNPDMSSSASSSFISGQESAQPSLEKDRARPPSPTSTFNSLNPNLGISSDMRGAKVGAGGLPRSRFADATDIVSIQKHTAARRANTSATNGTAAANTPFDPLVHAYIKCAVCGAVPKDAVQVTLSEPALTCRGCARGKVGGVGKITELPVCLLGLLREVVELSSVDPDSIHAKEDIYADENAVPIKRKVPIRRPGSRAPEGSVASPLAREFDDDIFYGLEEKERKTRMVIFADENAVWTQLMERMQNQSPRHKRNAGPNSRSLKMEADKKYEHADYTGALELYTKAIKLQKVDGACQLKFLLGNRSAAHFMAMRYKECMEDCLEIAKVDPDNSKMLCRAALSALSLGDLRQAVSILENTEPSRRSEQVSAKLAEYKSGLELYEKAERAFGTPQGDEFYRMLVAQFTNITPFRIRFAESLIQEKQYMRAVETLEAVAHASRSPQLCRIMAYGLYMSGFEHFERSRKILRDAAQLDDECRKLLHVIDQVDDAKQKGNTNFAQKNFKVAVENYAVAINLANDNEQILRILYCNRAAAHKELGNFRDGVGGLHQGNQH
ncbi:DnaJ like protein subfamily C member 7 [Strigomonas culicis]|uniref:DnaJ like protein subfamily C member 7 n=1 Tax=Strigomonas culicis TaxID=28005 RepID=S9UVY2_9TRYP|nr:DnaJ like protein subfamily C member 7 [Strigomonas culicis]|eukprot:EPY18681.1 DnaJ like protein subfamily C member 7 [Strigomonas culicis]